MRSGSWSLEGCQFRYKLRIGVNIEVSESDDATVAFLRQLKSSSASASHPSLRLALIRFCIQFDIEADDGVIALREVRRWET